MSGNGKDACIYFADGALVCSGVLFLYYATYIACAITHDTSVTGGVVKVNGEQGECLLRHQHFFQCARLDKRHVAIQHQRQGVIM